MDAIIKTVGELRAFLKDVSDDQRLGSMGEFCPVVGVRVVRQLRRDYWTIPERVVTHVTESGVPPMRGTKYHSKPYDCIVFVDPERRGSR